MALANGDLERGREGRFAILSKGLTGGLAEGQGLNRVNSSGRRHTRGPSRAKDYSKRLCDVVILSVFIMFLAQNS